MPISHVLLYKLLLCSSTSLLTSWEVIGNNTEIKMCVKIEIEYVQFSVMLDGGALSVSCNSTPTQREFKRSVYALTYRWALIPSTLLVFARFISGLHLFWLLCCFQEGQTVEEYHRALIPTLRFTLFPFSHWKTISFIISKVKFSVYLLLQLKF